VGFLTGIHNSIRRKASWVARARLFYRSLGATAPTEWVNPAESLRFLRKQERNQVSSRQLQTGLEPERGAHRWHKDVRGRKVVVQAPPAVQRGAGGQRPRRSSKEDRSCGSAPKEPRGNEMRHDRAGRSWRMRIAAPTFPGSSSANCLGLTKALTSNGDACKGAAQTPMHEGSRSTDAVEHAG